MLKRFTLFVFLFIVFGYFALCLFVYRYQSSIQYNPIKFKISPHEVGLSEVEIIHVVTKDGLKLEGWYMPAKDGYKTIVFFHGNGQLIGSSTKGVSQLAESGYGVLFAEYRGYAGHAGEVTEEGLYLDAYAFTEWLIRNQNIPEDNLIFYGESLGVALAVKMAGQYYSSGVVLLMPFSSALDIAKHHFWFFPMDIILKDRFLVYRMLQSVEEPILMIHGDQDRLIPIVYAERLYNSKSGNSKFVKIFGAHHHNLYDFDTMDYIKRFVESL